MNHQDNIKILNPIIVPLQGSSLIEASAGTGKTFTISLLYLRLILGLKNKDECPRRPLSVEEILVVTFTEVATNELRKRIIDDIHQLRLSCMRGKSCNNMHQSLLEQIDDTQKAIEILLRAESNISNATIYTIHSFCRKVLKVFNCEFNISLKNEIIHDEYNLLKKITFKFWNNKCCSMSLDLGRIIINEWKNAEDFLSTLYPIFKNKYIQSTDDLYYHSNNLELQHIENLTYINSIKNVWKMFYKDMLIYINSVNINKHIYNIKNLNNWIDKITIWANSITYDYEIPKELTKFRQSVIEKNIIGSFTKHILFEHIDNFLSLDLSLRNIFIKEAFIKISSDLKKEKNLHGLLSFDDLLYFLDKALKKSDGDLLANKIRNYFPVLLIDEFQDIDPQQYRIFHKIYLNQPKNILIIIGDPKQAIYAFRGADIYTYLNMRDNIKNVYTLEINWRSSPEMIESVNCLFSQKKLPFISNKISFNPVKPTIHNKTLKFILNKKKYPAMRFWIHPVDKINIINFEQDIAKQCASNVKNWLISANKKQAYLVKNDELYVLQPSDIAILVRNRREANIISNALNLFKISSVYLSDFNSVYNTIEAQELFYLLKAIQYPTQKRWICTALATSIFFIESAYIESLSTNDTRINIWINQFSTWKLLWHKYGLLHMIRTIISNNIMILDHSKCKLTNLVHLCELLQVEYIKSTGPNQLLNFFLNQIKNPDNHDINQQIRLEKDLNTIRIITIHKSKGLQYPLIWLPFAVNFAANNKNLYFFNKNFNQKERIESIISEDIRLLYVAVTRSIYHCSIGVSTFTKGIHKESTDLYKSALGYLLNCNKDVDLQTFINYINKLNIIDIKLIDF
ncbi:exodeoxyribonuclease V subunit beta [Pantoea sp. SoEX]|uniref:exodeoxyribonuclease V subunit beta n=1 Tax=Pantoea sp. SoEX TaxID=2576763 RepID=UPI00135AC57D|nr:exodeoxyribonuclease V subunit beta [Pantoea sp. SoEX]MXP51217.1 exodeoxyribonuclease V subunit beta [Pantoea sp. SoEX]